MRRLVEVLQELAVIDRFVLGIVLAVGVSQATASYIIIWAGYSALLICFASHSSSNSLKECWRRERPHIIHFFKQLIVATICTYLDSIAVYIVAVTHARRLENIELQDNVQILLKVLLRQSRLLSRAFNYFPELNAGEAVLHIIALCAFSALRGFSALETFSFFVRAWRWCRLLRVVCYSCTVLPSQFNDCFQYRFDETYSLSEHFVESIGRWRTGGGCNDLVYSGHGVILTLSALMFSRYGKQSGGSRWLSKFFWFRLLHATLRIIQSRMHMSVDMVLAVVITCLVWQHFVDKETLSKASQRLEKDASAQTEIAEHSRSTSSTTSERTWFIAFVAFAIGGFGMLAFPYEPPSPVSKFTDERIRAVALSSLVPLKPESKFRLFCAITMPYKHDVTRCQHADAVKDTWGKHCDGLLIWDELCDETVGSLSQKVSKSEVLVDEPLHHRWLQTRLLWRHIATNKLSEFDWFIAVEAGTYIFVDNFRRLIAALPAAGILPTSPAHIVHTAPVSKWGYVLNAFAVHTLVRAFDANLTSCKGPLNVSRSSRENDFVSACLRDSVPSTYWDEDHDLRHALGCEYADKPLTVFDLKLMNYSEETGLPRGICTHAVVATAMAMRPQQVRHIDASLVAARTSGAKSFEDNRSHSRMGQDNRTDIARMYEVGLRSILQKRAKLGLPLLLYSEVVQEFRNAWNIDFDVTELGHDSVAAYLLSLPQSFRITVNDEGQAVVLRVKKPKREL